MFESREKILESREEMFFAQKNGRNASVNERAELDYRGGTLPNGRVSAQKPVFAGFCYAFVGLILRRDVDFG